MFGRASIKMVIDERGQTFKISPLLDSDSSEVSKRYCRLDERRLKIVLDLQTGEFHAGKMREKVTLSLKTFWQEMNKRLMLRITSSKS